MLVILIADAKGCKELRRGVEGKKDLMIASKVCQLLKSKTLRNIYINTHYIYYW
jgi:hypothetical protein